LKFKMVSCVFWLINTPPLASRFFSSDIVQHLQKKFHPQYVFFD
jgi:hypothetical protein